jgi:aminoglycoside phosphotransferase (APT) family kinase protein
MSRTYQDIKDTYSQKKNLKKKEKGSIDIINRMQSWIQTHHQWQHQECKRDSSVARL